MTFKKKNRERFKKITRLLGLDPPITPALQGFIQTGWKTLSHPPLSIQGPKNKVPSFSFSVRTFRDKTSSSLIGPRSVSIPAFLNGILEPIYCFFIKPKNHIFPFPMVLPPHVIPRAVIPSLLLLGGCKHVEPKSHIVLADFKVVEEPYPVDGSIHSPVLSRPQIISGSKDGKATTAKSQRIRRTKFEGPIRFAFTDVPVDLILRRISEFTDLQFIAEEQLLVNSSVTLDLTVSTSEEIYDLVEIVGSMLGVQVKWEGKKAIFTASTTQGTRPSDGYLISPIKLSPDTAAVINARYEVQCTLISNLTLCLGTNDNLDVTQRFIKAVDTARDLVSYRLVTTEVNLTAVAETFGLTDRLVVSRLKNKQWLLVANDPRHFDLVLEVSENVSKNECEEYIFTPLHVSVELLAPLVPVSDVGTCPPSVFVGSRIVLSGSPLNVRAARNILVKMDKPKPVARLFVLIGSDARNLSFGADVDGFNGRIPSQNIFDAVTLSAALARSSGWRSIEVVTDGISRASISSSDRVQGNVIVTDGGSQVTGVEDRTVGLSIEIDGVVTRSGYRGRVNFSDSSLDGEITRSSQCSSYIALDLHELAKICVYDRDEKSLNAGILNASKRKSADTLHVFVGLVAHEIAALETLRKVIA